VGMTHMNLSPSQTKKMIWLLGIIPGRERETKSERLTREAFQRGRPASQIWYVNVFILS
jgi:hypothetical protein